VVRGEKEMREEYRDIRSRIAEEPKWFDENGVPRYDEFHPDMLANVYADECVLTEEACQSCGRKYLLASSCTCRWVVEGSLRDRILHGLFSCGDIPCFSCLSGATMLSLSLRVMQYWRCSTLGVWERRDGLDGRSLNGRKVYLKQFAK
jgi:hypothetical protein